MFKKLSGTRAGTLISLLTWARELCTKQHWRDKPVLDCGIRYVFLFFAPDYQDTQHHSQLPDREIIWCRVGRQPHPLARYNVTMATCQGVFLSMQISSARNVSSVYSSNKCFCSFATRSEPSRVHTIGPPSELAPMPHTFVSDTYTHIHSCFQRLWLLICFMPMCSLSQFPHKKMIVEKSFSLSLGGGRLTPPYTEIYVMNLDLLYARCQQVQTKPNTE